MPNINDQDLTKNDDENNSDIVKGEFENGNNNATELIRRKLADIYAEEPDAEEELEETEETAPAVRSKHENFMQELSSSGKDLAVIQTEWHEYYTHLPEDEKHKVWQEFYDKQSNLTGLQDKPKPSAVIAPKKAPAITSRLPKKIAAIKQLDPRTTEDVENDVRGKVENQRQKLTVKHHIQSLAFGLSMGLLVVFIFLFSFFNEVFIAPFIQPSRASAATPIILSSSGVAPTTTPEVIIPKINVQIPVNYNEKSDNEDAIENDLEGGVVHYPSTVFPGQNGNAAFFGHSSNNIFNSGAYKFAFVNLHDMQIGDTFYLTYNDKVYVYKVINKQIVSPNDVSVLDPVEGQTATATLITCDPPGTSINRLVVLGQQISPSPTSNTTASATTASVTKSVSSAELPGNGPTAWTSFTHSAFGKLVMVAAVLGLIVFGVYRFNRKSLIS